MLYVRYRQGCGEKKRWGGAIVEKGSRYGFFLAFSFSKKHSEKLTVFVTLGLNLCK